MSSTKLTKKTKLTFKPKKATFTVVGVGKNRVFTVVNKRAKYVARKAGKRSKLTVSQLKALKGTGSYKYFVWVDGSLKAVRI